VLWVGGMWFQDLWTYDFRRTEMCVNPVRDGRRERSRSAHTIRRRMAADRRRRCTWSRAPRSGSRRAGGQDLRRRPSDGGAGRPQACRAGRRAAAVAGAHVTSVGLTPLQPGAAVAPSPAGRCARPPTSSACFESALRWRARTARLWGHYSNVVRKPLQAQGIRPRRGPGCGGVGSGTDNGFVNASAHRLEQGLNC